MPSKKKAATVSVQEKMDAITEVGYMGTKVDPTPNENYTLAGVVAGLPTPETTRGPEDRAGVPLALASGGVEVK